MKLVLVLLFLLMLGCNPDRFTLNRMSENVLFGQIMNDLDSFSQTNDNSFILSDGKVAIRNYLKTQNDFKFNLRLLKGKKINLIVRAVEHNYDPGNGLIIQLTDKGLTVFEKSRSIVDDNSIRLINNINHYISIRNVGNRTIINFDCHELVVHSSLPSTEFLIIDASDDSMITISGISSEKVMDNVSEKNLSF